MEIPGYFSYGDSSVIPEQVQFQALPIQVNKQKRIPSRGKPLAFSVDTHQLAVKRKKPRGLEIWNCKTGRCERIFYAHTSKILYAEFSKDGDSFLSSSLDCTIRIWSIASSSLIHRIDLFSFFAQEVHFSRDEGYLIGVVQKSIDGDKRLAIINFEKHKIFLRKGRFKEVAFSKDCMHIRGISREDEVTRAVHNSFEWQFALNACSALSELEEAKREGATSLPLLILLAFIAEEARLQVFDRAQVQS